MPSPVTDTASRQRERRARRFWVGLILAFLVTQMTLVSIMAYVASSDRSFAIEPDYYQKGLHWDDTAAQLRKNAELGWSLRIELSEQANDRGERTLTCRLTNKVGQPLDGATVDLVAFAHAAGNARSLTTLTPAGDGAYETDLNLARPGVWEFRAVVKRGPETFTHKLERYVTPDEK